MFISKYEKEEMRISVRTLQAKVKELEDRINRLSNIITKDTPPAKKRQGRGWDEASRRAASEAMKRSWAARKARKAAMAQSNIDKNKV